MNEQNWKFEKQRRDLEEQLKVQTSHSADKAKYKRQNTNIL